MKRTILLFTASYKSTNTIEPIKQEIAEYLGNRMIEDKMDKYPQLVINQPLFQEDIDYIANLICNKSKDMCVYLIETNFDKGGLGVVTKLKVEGDEV